MIAEYALVFAVTDRDKAANKRGGISAFIVERDTPGLIIGAKEDKLGLHRFKSDEAYLIGEDLGPVAAYLSIP